MKAAAAKIAAGGNCVDATTGLAPIDDLNGNPAGQAGAANAQKLAIGDTLGLAGRPGNVAYVLGAPGVAGQVGIQETVGDGDGCPEPGETITITVLPPAGVNNADWPGGQPPAPKIFSAE